MCTKEDKNIAGEKLLRFVNKYLDGNIDNIVSFPLSKLYHDKEFGCPSDRRFDFDDTELMRCIYVLIFSDIWPGLSLDTLANYSYRGDTMNTYNTLFGRPEYGGCIHPGLEKFSPSPELSAKVADFRLEKYNRIGNMVVFPNIWLNGTTINRYRGCHPRWRDFFDRFLVAFKDVLVGSKESDKGLINLVRANSEYLSPFISEDGFNKMTKGLFLEDYLDAAGNPVIRSKGFYFWNRSLNPIDYCQEAHRYIDFSNRVIENRSKRMLDALKSNLLIINS